MPKRENSEIETDATSKLIELLKRAGDHPRETKNSGSARSEPDIVTPYGIFEAKGTDNFSFSITPGLMNKFIDRAASYPGLGAIFVNTKQTSFFAVDMTTFFILWKLYITGVEDQEIEEAERIYELANR